MNTTRQYLRLIGFLTLTLILNTCAPQAEKEKPQEKIRIILDTDANNELDDQHALAYLLFNGDHFDVEGITVNATSHYEGYNRPSLVADHYEEAKRVMQLCGGLYGKIPLLTGAQGSFGEIRKYLDSPEFDGQEAVDFIIEKALEENDRELVVCAIGKLTNVALALEKELSIASRIRVVWLGSNYPEPGEHNLDWDIGSMNYILDSDVPFEMVTVRYGEPSGTAAVMVSRDQILHRMPGLGPEIEEPVKGRHGGSFRTWGDYSVNLYREAGLWGDPPGRSLFDLAAVAILKNPGWAESRSIPAPTYTEEGWVERPENQRSIILWEWFHVYAIPQDFFNIMEHYQLAQTP